LPTRNVSAAAGAAANACAASRASRASAARRSREDGRKLREKEIMIDSRTGIARVRAADAKLRFSATAG
jgi:hypothetical protein